MKRDDVLIYLLSSVLWCARYRTKALNHVDLFREDQLKKNETSMHVFQQFSNSYENTRPVIESSYSMSVKMIASV